MSSQLSPLQSGSPFLVTPPPSPLLTRLSSLGQVKREHEEDIDYFFKRPAVAPPPAPVKKRILLGSALKFKEMDEQLQTGELTYAGTRHKVQLLGNGSYMNAYSIVTPGVICGRLTSDVVVKAFHNHRIYKNSGLLEKFMEHSLANYKELRELGFPTCEILNAETAINDRCYIVKKINQSIDTTLFTNINKIAELSSSDLKILCIVREFFRSSIEKNLFIDLYPDNIRLEEEKPVIIDFMEEKVTKGFFPCETRARLKEWVQNNHVLANFFSEVLPKDEYAADKLVSSVDMGAAFIAI